MEMWSGTSAGHQRCQSITHLHRRVGIERRERRTWFAARKSGEVHRLLQPGDAKAGCHEFRQRRQPPLQRTRLVVAAGAEVLVQLDAQGWQDARHGEDPAGGTDAQRRIESRRRSGDHRESIGHRGDKRGKLRRVAARFLDADDVGMRRQSADGVRRQVDAVTAGTL